ncbi:MAG TPA: hypothetical protein VMM57_07930 [Bacteroidota bacterium]|nr:hypothetical protein [Bacteroidota bacterium]
MKRSLFLSGLLAASFLVAAGQEKIRHAFIVNEPAESEYVVPNAPQSYSYADRKSVTLAVVYSLLLPGMGEWYAGNFESGKYSLIADAALWGTFAAFRIDGGWIRSDDHAFAMEHSGASFAGKGDQFDVDIGNYLSTAAYNESKLQQRQFDQLYLDPSYAWSWDSDADRQKFKDTRIRSDAIYQSAKFSIAALAVNRLLSAFAAGRAAAAFNRSLRAEEDWRIEVAPIAGPLGGQGLSLELEKHF